MIIKKHTGRMLAEPDWTAPAYLDIHIKLRIQNDIDDFVADGIEVVCAKSFHVRDGEFFNYEIHYFGFEKEHPSCRGYIQWVADGSSEMRFVDYDNKKDSHERSKCHNALRRMERPVLELTQ